MKDFIKLEAEIAEAGDKLINIESINEFKIKFSLKKSMYSTSYMRLSISLLYSLKIDK